MDRKQRFYELIKVDSIRCLNDFVYWTKPAKFYCSVCEHEWITSPSKVEGGTRCPNCAKNCHYDTDMFIIKSQQKHGNKYTYTRTNFINSRTPVIVTCSRHGDFLQNPNDHLQGYGCAQCAGCKRLSNEEFDKKLTESNRGVIRVGEYINSYTPILVQCVACNHKWAARPTKLHGKHATGCPKCRTKKGVFGTYVEHKGYKFRSILESKCYDVVEEFTHRRGFTFQCQKTYPQSKTNHSCDFYVNEIKLWIEVSGIQTETYRTRIQRKVGWVDELGENFIFAKNAEQLKEILNGEI